MRALQAPENIIGFFLFQLEVRNIIKLSNMSPFCISRLLLLGHGGFLFRCTLCMLPFFFEIIIDSQEVAKIVRSDPKSPHLVPPVATFGSNHRSIVCFDESVYARSLNIFLITIYSIAWFFLFI